MKKEVLGGDLLDIVIHLHRQTALQFVEPKLSNINNWDTTAPQKITD